MEKGSRERIVCVMVGKGLLQAGASHSRFGKVASLNYQLSISLQQNPEQGEARVDI